jgi:ketosteroid isomerase-like protein
MNHTSYQPLLLAGLLLVGHAPAPPSATPHAENRPLDISAAQQTVLARENAILDRWDNGDPMGFIDVAADDVTYFGPELGRRVDGKTAFRERLLPIVGKIHNPPRRMEAPMVRVYGEIAILTFVDVYDFPTAKSIWNVTEVYRLTDGEWKLIHSQWAEAKRQ